MSTVAGRRYHVISGLPRAGTTMLGAILSQNPRVSAGMSSPVQVMTTVLMQGISMSPETAAIVTDDMRLRLFRGLFDAVHGLDPGKSLVFDTGRDWAGRIPELAAAFEDIKIILMLRNPAWIMDSFERLLRRDPLRRTTIGPLQGPNVEARFAGLMAKSSLLGRSLASSRDAVFGPDSDRVLVIEYEAFCADPRLCLDAIYRFIGEEPYEHDLNNVTFTQTRFDDVLGIPDAHRVQGPVELRTRKTILPMELFDHASKLAFWNYSDMSHVARILVNG